MAFGLAWGLFALFALAPDAVVSVAGELSATNPLFILAVCSPARSAVTLALLHAGPGGLFRHLSRLLLWRCSRGWTAFLLFGIPAISCAGAAIKGTLGACALPFTSPCR